jgi:hypothetical protein
MLVMLNAAFHALVSVTVCGGLVVATVWLGKVRLLGARVTPAPVPVNVTVCGLPPPASAIESVAERVPDAAGVNVTLKVQFAPGATPAAGQLFVWAKSPGLVPVMLGVIVRVCLVNVFVRVTN